MNDDLDRRVKFSVTGLLLIPPFISPAARGRASIDYSPTGSTTHIHVNKKVSLLSCLYTKGAVKVCIVKSNASSECPGATWTDRTNHKSLWLEQTVGSLNSTCIPLPLLRSLSQKASLWLYADSTMVDNEYYHLSIWMAQRVSKGAATATQFLRRSYTFANMLPGPFEAS